MPLIPYALFSRFFGDRAVKGSFLDLTVTRGSVNGHVGVSADGGRKPVDLQGAQELNVVLRHYEATHVVKMMVTVHLLSRGILRTPLESLKIQGIIL